MSDVHRWTVPCGECGEETEHIVTSVLCDECLEEKYPFPDPDELTEERVIYESELRELVEEWREEADSAPHPMCSESVKGICADELEVLIEGETECH